MTKLIQSGQRPPLRARVRTFSMTVMTVCLLSIAGMANAVHDLFIFELDENTDDANFVAFPDDWEALYNGGALTGANSEEFLFISPDQTDPVLVELVESPLDTIFAGNSKDTLDVSDWKWKIGEPNDKNDIQHVFVSAYTVPLGAPEFAGDLILYFGIDKLDNSGDAALGVWFLQDDVSLFDDGKTNKPFIGNHIKDDVLVQVDFTNGGNIDRLDVYQWDAGVGTKVSNSSDLWRVLEAQDCDDIPEASDLVCGQVNQQEEDAPWPMLFKGPGGVSNETVFKTATFFEAGINITEFLGRNVCFGTVVAETRQSQSETSVVEDLALGDFNLCEIMVTKDGPPLNKIGDEGTYSFTIENTGAVPLFLEAADDDVIGDLIALGVVPAACDELLPGQSCSFDAPYTPDGTDPDPLTNTFIAVYNSESDFTGDTIMDDADHDTTLFDPDVSVTKEADVAAGKVGDPVDYTVTITNASDADTPDITCTATDALLGGEIFNDTVPAGDTVINVQRNIQGGDPDPLVNTVDISCMVDGFPNVINDTDDASVATFEPAIDVTKDADVSVAKVGDSITYTIVLANNSTGSAPDLNCVATDSLSGEIFNGVLALGNTQIQVMRNVMAGDPDPLVNTVTLDCDVAGLPNQLSDSDDASVDTFEPAIAVTKVADKATAKVGDTVEYTITLSNNSTGSAPPLTCTATDSLLGVVFGPAVLPLGDTPIVVNRDVMAGDSSPLVNEVDLVCSPDGFPNVLEVSDSASVDLFMVGVEVDKQASAALAKVGDTIDYTITLSNISSAGSPDLTCTATDSLLGVVYGPAVLPLGDTVLNPSRDVMAGDPSPLVNTVVVDCTVDGFPNMVSDDSSAQTDLFVPAIDATKTASASLAKVGDTIDYEITLFNNSDGNTPDLTCTATDTLQGVVFGPAVLPAGPTPINYSRDVMGGDADPLVNAVTLDCSVAGFPNQLSASDDVSIELFQPAIAVDKQADRTLAKVGDTVNYTITLSNNSSADTPPMTCVADDSLLGPIYNAILPLGDTVLNPSRDVMAGDSSPLVNQVSVSCTFDDFPNVLVDDSSASVDLFNAAIDVTKTASANLAKVGDTIDYTVTLFNNSDGNTPDLDCVATDSLQGELFNGVLPLGATPIPYSREVMAGDADPLVNAVALNCNVVGFTNVLNAADDVSIELFQPAIAVDKQSDRTLAKVGDTVNYTITLSNNSSADTPPMTCVADDSLLGEIYNAVLPLGDTVLNPSRDVEAGDSTPLVNQVDVLCTFDDFPNELVGSSSASVDLFNAAIDVSKSASANLAKVGDTIDYTVTLFNNSDANTPDLDCVANDSLVGEIFNGVLPLGATPIPYSRDVMAGDGPTLTNTVTLECAVSGFTNTLRDDASANVDIFSPAIDVDKSASSNLAKVGDTIDYTVTLFNNSDANTPDLNCVATDSLQGELFNGVLPLGATPIPYSRQVMAGDNDPLVNAVTLNCSVVGFTNVLDASDDVSVDLFQPAMSVSKQADVTVAKVGDPVEYTIRIDNNSSGDTPAMNCVADDTLLGVVYDGPVANGGFEEIVVVRQVQAGDSNPLVNEVFVDCTLAGFPNVLSDNDSASVEVFEPAIDISKQAAVDFAKVGDTIAYSITLSNNSTANTPAMTCTATDSLTGVVFGPAVLPLGDTVVGANYDVQAGDASPLVNTVTMDCTIAGLSNQLSDDASDEVTLLTPDYEVAKSCINSPVPSGASANFEIDITNTGDTPLIISVMDPLLSINESGIELGTGGGCIYDADASDGCLRFEEGVIAAGTEIFNEVFVSATLPASTNLPNEINKDASAVCDVVGGTTRTIGFWRTHGSNGAKFNPPVDFGYTCHVFEQHLGGTMDLGWVTLNSCAEVFGAFWANNARESNRKRRSKVCQAKVQASKQMVGAILNTGLDNGAGVPIDPETGLDLITALRLEQAGDMDRREIIRLGSLLDDYNNSGDDEGIVDLDGAIIPNADPNGTRDHMDISAVDCP